MRGEMNFRNVCSKIVCVRLPKLCCDLICSLFFIKTEKDYIKCNIMYSSIKGLSLYRTAFLNHSMSKGGVTLCKNDQRNWRQIDQIWNVHNKHGQYTRRICTVRYHLYLLGRYWRNIDLRTAFLLNETERSDLHHDEVWKY